MLFRKVILYGLMLFFVPVLFAQSQERREEMADSIQQVLNTQSLTDRQKIDIYKKLSLVYQDYDVEKTISTLKKGLELSEKSNIKDHIPFFTRSLGVLYGMQARYDSAKIYLDRSLAFAKEINDQSEEIQAYRAIAYWHYRQNDYVKTFDNSMESLKISEVVNDTTGQLIALVNIASLYRELGNLDRALFYIQKSFDTSRKYNIGEYWMTHYELSLVYLEKGELDKALEYGLKAVSEFRGRNKTFEIYSMQAVAKIYTQKKDLSQALEYADESIRLARSYGDMRLQTIGMQILSSIYCEQKRFVDCETTAFTAWNNDSTMLDTAPELAYNIAFSNLQLGNKEKSARFFEKYALLVKEQNIKNFHKTMADTEIQYETEKKETRIATLEKQRKFYVGLGVLSLAILLLAFTVLFYRHRLNLHKRKLSEQQIKQLEQEKQLIATLSVLEGENAERSRLSRDLHDGLGGILSVIKLNLRNIKTTDAMSEADQSRFAGVLEMLDQFIVELRRVAHNMMPESLMREGIKASLEDFCRSIPNANFQFFGENPKIDNHIEMLIYRCAYELINNAIRHADAQRIDVQLTVDEKLVSLTVRDDGVGFDPETVKYGNGLKNMHDRISAYNGKINMYSSPGNGTEINIEIELP